MNSEKWKELKATPGPQWRFHVPKLKQPNVERKFRRTGETTARQMRKGKKAFRRILNHGH